MGSCHDYVSLSTRDISKAHLSDLYYRPDEIKYVWKVEGRWTIATVLFGFVRHSNHLRRLKITFSWLRTDI